MSVTVRAAVALKKSNPELAIVLSRKSNDELSATAR